MRMTIQLQVTAGEETLLARTLAPNRPLRLGPGASATIPTLGLQAEVQLLEPAGGGYRVHLPAGLDGVLSVGGRRLRVERGLLLDPRPEPLLLVDGDGGRFDLDGNLRLRFSVHAERREFRALPRLDRGLAISLGGSALAGALLALCIAHDLGSPARGSRLVLTREARLSRRPASLIALQRRSPRRLELSGAQARRARPRAVAPSRPRASSPIGRAQASARQQERILRRLLPRGGRGGDPLAALEGLLGDRRAREGAGRLESGPRRTGAGSDLLTGSAAASLGLPAALALPRLGPLRRVQPLALPAANRPSGGPSREAIRRVVSHGSAGVRLCYERELLAARVAKEGQILLRWTIDSSGRVSELGVARDTVGSPELERCLRAQVAAWSFPPCPERCVVHYPFEFAVPRSAEHQSPDGRPLGGV